LDNIAVNEGGKSLTRRRYGHRLDGMIAAADAARTDSN